jgi:hypothetical protein
MVRRPVLIGSNIHGTSSIYAHPNNSDFRELRPNPNVIYRGDLVFIPELEAEQFDRATDCLHQFKLNQSRTLLRVVICEPENRPVSASYSIVADGLRRTGETGTDGLIQEVIPCHLEQASLEVVIRRDGAPAIMRHWTLKLGHLDPVEELSGIQARLNNLGYEAGSVNGLPGPRTEAAIRRFQEWAGLKVDGSAGENTQRALGATHGC